MQYEQTNQKAATWGHSLGNVKKKKEKKKL